MAALPFPGRAGGIRFTITEEDLGIVCESSLSSAKDARMRGYERGQTIISRLGQTFCR